MKLTLLHPPRMGGRGTNLVPPVGLLYLAAVLERDGHEVTLVDAALTGETGDALAATVAGSNPDILLVSAFTSDVAALVRELPAIRGALPRRAPVWLGGPHASCRGPAAFGDLPGIDAVFVGEAEESLPRALAACGSGDPVPGVILASNPVETEPQIVEDLSSLPLPAWHHAPPRMYRGLPNGVVLRRMPYAPVITTRGCPYRCTFCAGFRVTGRRIRHRPLDHVWREIELLHREHGVREIHIEDDNFTFDRDYAAAFCRRAVEAGLPLLFSTPNGVRLDRLDAELLRLMKTAGWYVVHCGIESGSDRILELVRKGTDTASIAGSLELIRKAGLPTAGYFILGLPGETREDIEATIRFARRSSLSWAHFAAFLPIPGSEAGDEYLARHDLSPDGWGAFHNTACPAPPDGMSCGELKKLQRKAFMSFYARPGPILRTLRLLLLPGVAPRLVSRMLAYLSRRPSMETAG